MFQYHEMYVFKHFQIWLRSEDRGVGLCVEECIVGNEEEILF